MRALRRNQQLMKYASLLGTVPVYDIDADGSIKYILVNGIEVPQETGDKRKVCADAQEFQAVISMAGSEAETMAFGFSMADYEAVLSYPKGYVTLKEGDMIWFTSEVESLYLTKTEVTINRKNYSIMGVLPESADYMVAKVSYSLNEAQVILKAVTKKV